MGWGVIREAAAGADTFSQSKRASRRPQSPPPLEVGVGCAVSIGCAVSVGVATGMLVGVTVGKAGAPELWEGWKGWEGIVMEMLCWASTIAIPRTTPKLNRATTMKRSTTPQMGSPSVRRDCGRGCGHVGAPAVLCTRRLGNVGSSFAIESHPPSRHRAGVSVERASTGRRGIQERGWTPAYATKAAKYRHG